MERLLREAAELAARGAHGEARARLAEATDAAPHSEAAWLARAKLATDPWMAAAFAGRALEANPHNAEAQSLAAVAHRQLGGAPAAPAVQASEGPASQPRSGRGAVAAALNRLGYTVVVLLAIVYLTFFGLEMARRPRLLPALGHGATETLGYLGQLAQGDLGVSTSVRARLVIPVAEVLPDAFLKSLGLLLFAVVLAAMIGIPLGSLAARPQRSPSAGLLLVSLVGVSLPSFFTALLLQLVVIWMVRTFERQILPVGGFGWDAHILLPALVLAARPIAQIFRVTSVSLAQVLEQDYIRTARSKGIPPLPLLWRHVYRNVAIPVLTTIGLSIRFSLISLPVVEVFFSWTGAGFNLIRAISQNDDQLAVAFVLSFGLFFLLVNQALETLYRRIDPRLRQAQCLAVARRADLRDGLSGLWMLLVESIPIRWLRRGTAADRDE
ncbi:MAG: ABC transporter permease subunit, partial [Chloroflexi bacterium]|nr:ABC transporter permease subunit [Chloroflexota bacterium]